MLWEFVKYVKGNSIVRASIHIEQLRYKLKIFV